MAALKGIFGGPPQTQARRSSTVVVPTRDDPSIEEARRKTILLANKAAGRSSTNFTGGAGVQTAANVRKASLLGGTAA